MQVNHLLSIWLSGGEESKAIRDRLEEKIDSYGAGKLDHAVDAILCIWEVSNKEEPAIPDFSRSLSRSARTSTTSISAVRFTGCSIRPSLVKSIKEGHLFDRKYWAKKSRGGRIEPIYFSSAATGAELIGFDACESPSHGDACGVKLSSIGAAPGIRRTS